jgi:hypothetical protein
MRLALETWAEFAMRESFIFWVGGFMLVFAAIFAIASHIHVQNTIG